MECLEFMVTLHNSFRARYTIPEQNLGFRRYFSRQTMRAIFILPVAVATLLLASDVTAGGIQGLGHMKIDKVVMGGPVQSEAAQASALRQRFLRSHEETDADNEERVLNKSLMLRNEDHKMFIFQKWYDAGKSSMWAYDKLKIGTGEKYEKYRDLYNEYARFRLARNK